MSRRQVVVRLTELEAEAMAYALGNSLYCDEDAESLFAGSGDAAAVRRDVAAAFRAQAKLATARRSR